MNYQEKHLSEQAEKLGGAWRLDHGFMPIIILTTEEAALIIKKLENNYLNINAGPLAVKYTDREGKELIFDIRDITFMYRG